MHGHTYLKLMSKSFAFEILLVRAYQLHIFGKYVFWDEILNFTYSNNCLLISKCLITIQLNETKY
jgi:hypothetical protein